MSRKLFIQFVAIVGAVMLLYVASIGPVFAIAVNRAYGQSDLHTRVTRLNTFYYPLKQLTDRSDQLRNFISMWSGIWVHFIPQEEQPPVSG